MTEVEFGFVAMVAAALVVFAVTLAYASAVASGSTKQVPPKAANTDAPGGKSMAAE